MNILNLENLSLVLGAKTILDGVNFAMNDREKVGVIGINGTGKSTLLRIAAGDLVPDGGKVTRANGLRISYLSQNPVFDPDRSILENVAARVYGKEAHWNTEGEVRAMLLRFGIPNPDCSPAILSGGQL